MRTGMLDERQAVYAMVADVVDAVEAELDVLVTSIEDRVRARMPASDRDPSTAHDEALRSGVEAAVREALARLRSQTDPPQELPPELIELARMCAGSRCEAPALEDPWLTGEEVFWDRFQVVAERTLTDTAICWDVIKTARVLLRGQTARLSPLFRRACEREVAPVNGIETGSRQLAVLRALDGQWVDPSELGYDLAFHHIAVIADAAPILDATARRTRRQLLKVKAPDGGTWGWLGGETSMSEDELDAVIASHDDSDAQVAYGEPAEGIAGFASSHHQAVEARAIAAATNRSAVRFADFRVLIAVLRDDDLAKEFIERELGALGRPSERMTELRETLRVYLEHSQSVSATAALRRRNRKTIERQLRSAEELIHHRVSDRSDDVLIALRVAEILGHRD
jgi:hypothetical protein